MDDHTSTQSFPNLHHHHHHHRPSFHLTLPSLQSPEVGYQAGLDPLEQYGSRGQESAVSFPDLASSSGARRRGSDNDRGLQSMSGSGLDEDGSLRRHLERDGGSGGHFVDTWYGGGKQVVDWEDGESCDSTADDFYRKGDGYGITNGSSYTLNCGRREGLRQKLGANYNSYARASWDAKREIVYNREANVSHLTKETTSPSRSAAGGFDDNSADYRRSDSRGSDHYLGREEDYGSRCGSGEDQNQAADPEGPWLNLPPYTLTGEGRWRGEPDTLASTCPPQRSPIAISSGTYTQKLDSFSEAFLSQRKKMFPAIHGEDSSGQIWEFGAGRGESPGLIKSRQSCGFDSDSYLLPYSSPNQPSLPPFPSPPTSSHIMSSVLSPPPTPLPPPPHSPSKMDSLGSFGGSGHSVFQEEESLGAIQFFNPRLQSLPPVLSSGMMWKYPLLSHCFSQSPCDPSSNEGNLRSPHGADYVPRDILQSPESTYLPSPSHPPPRALCPLNTPPLHLACPSSHLSGLNNGAAQKVVPYTVNQKVKKGQATLNQSLAQQQAPPLYTGTPFPSVLHSCGGQKRGHYTPRPLLNPVRKGTGLFSTLSSSLHHEDDKVEEDCGVLQCVNIGHGFQAELPTCFVNGNRPEVRSPEEDSSREQLLWKPLPELEESVNMQNQVEKLLSLCSSSCLPGGGSNTELALHCLQHCQGNMVATVEMLLFWPPSPAGDYHYAGSDLWTDAEKSLFDAALETRGKDFALIQETVRTKTVSQCVEFYYLSKKLLDKQRKQREEEKREGELELQKSATPICQPVDRQFGLAETVPVPSLASFFPCKLCGKMFYKIKSRNAHMKIHRQPQEDWADRRLQHQLLTQRLALSRSTSLLPPQTAALAFSSSSGLAGTPGNNSFGADASTVSPGNASVTYNDGVAASNAHVIAAINDSNPREQSSASPYQHSWDSFGHGPSPAAFFCHAEGKGDVAGKVGGEEPISW